MQTLCICTVLCKTKRNENDKLYSFLVCNNFFCLNLMGVRVEEAIQQLISHATPFTQCPNYYYTIFKIVITHSFGEKIGDSKNGEMDHFTLHLQLWCHVASCHCTRLISIARTNRGQKWSQSPMFFQEWDDGSFRHLQV